MCVIFYFIYFIFHILPGILLLSEVALGEEYKIGQSEYMEKAPKGKHSTKGVGGSAPDVSGEIIIDESGKIIGKNKDQEKKDEGKKAVGKGKKAAKGEEASADAAREGIVVPLGKVTKNHEVGKAVNHSSLLYNEYIVYDVNQIRMKYLIRTKFVYKQSKY